MNEFQLSYDASVNLQNNQKQRYKYSINKIVNIFPSFISLSFCSCLFHSVHLSFLLLSLLPFVISLSFCSSLLPSVISLFFCSSLFPSVISLSFCSSLFPSVIFLSFCSSLFHSVHLSFLLLSLFPSVHLSYLCSSLSVQSVIQNSEEKIEEYSQHQKTLEKLIAQDSELSFEDVVKVLKPSETLERLVAALFAGCL